MSRIGKVALMSRYEWDPAPPTMRQRIVAGFFVGAIAISLASAYFGWRLFGDYDKQVAGVTLFVWAIVFVYLMPTARRS